MDNTVAVAPRNLLRIKRRQLADLLLRGTRKALRKATGHSQERVPSDLLVYPPVYSTPTLRDVCNRLAWYLPPSEAERPEIRIPVGGATEPAVPEAAPDAQESYDKSQLDVSFVDPQSCVEPVSEQTLVLYHDVYRGLVTELLPLLRHVEIVDPEFYSSIESTNWPRATKPLRGEADDRSRERFETLERDSDEANRSFVFATGPSLDRAWEYDFSPESVKIVCNSIVRNRELLTHIDPDVLVFADPVFHFGPSKYAAEFRKDAVEVLNEFDCAAVVPDLYRSLLAGHHPDITKDTVGMEFVDSNTLLYPSEDSLRVAGTDNIMTLLMLPIASSLTDTVYVVGADGREEGESYFWEHSNEAQYDDELMETAVRTHPSFFRDRVYADYYDQHVNTLTEYIRHGEQNGVEYRSLTESHVPCLQERYDPQIRA